MSVIETYRVLSGKTRAIIYFERSEEVCACVAELIVERRIAAGLHTPPGTLRRVAEALRDGVKFIENEQGVVVPAPKTREPSKAFGSPSRREKAQGALVSVQTTGNQGAKKRRRRRKKKKNQGE